MISLHLLSSSTPLSMKLHHGFSSHNNMLNNKIICKKIEDSSSVVEYVFPKKPYFSKSSLLSFEAPPSVSLTTAAITTMTTTHVDNYHDENIKQLLPGDLRHELMPKHVAVIMDGHGRWAKNQGLPTQYGHYVGFMVKLKEMILSCCRLGIRIFTVYSFSSENWSRPKEEIDCLMNLFEDLIQSHIKELIFTHGLRFSVIGDRTKLPKYLQDAIFWAEESSKSNRGLHFVMAISYSGQNELTEAVKNIARRIEDGTLGAKDIDKSVLERQLQTSNTVEFPYVDLLIRTSGELRLSNFMLWQSAYAEFYFCDKLLPDFEEDDFIDALESFQKRRRRYGGRKV